MATPARARTAALVGARRPFAARRTGAGVLPGEANLVIAEVRISLIGVRLFLRPQPRGRKKLMDTTLESFLNSLGEAERAGGRILHELTDQAHSFELRE